VDLRRVGLPVLLFVSGALGLVYEVCWSRELALHVGLGERGSALTLSAFFLGMTLGYGAAARLHERVAALQGYAVCELLLAGWAVALPWWSALLPTQSGLWFWLSLLPPCAAMGASLPFALESYAEVRGNVSLAYAAQLAGATLGALLATFSWIERLGIFRCTQLAALLSAGCGVIALRLAPREHPPRLPAEEAQHVHVGPMLAAAWTGALTLALEVLCIRLFALTFHNSTYTFGLVVATFIVCLALGSRSVAQVPLSEARRRLSQTAQLAALGTLGAAPLFEIVTHFGSLRAWNFASYMALSAGLTLFVLLVPVTTAGAILPLLWRATPVSTARTVGVLGAANGVGAAIGALLASFVLLPRMGLFGAFGMVASGYVLLAWWCAGLSLRRLPLTFGLWLLCLFAPTPVLPLRPGETLERRWQTSYGLLDAVREPGRGGLSARLDLHYELGRSADVARHRSMGAFPLALKPDARHVLFLGLATGMTASAARLRPELTRIDILELIPEMRELAARFAPYNAGLLHDPRVNLTIGDARRELARSREQYDVMVSDLFVPWHQGAAYLYTVEHFENVRAHLRGDGVFVLWLPLWQLGASELALIVDSFRDVFPDLEAWLDTRASEKPTLALVGGDVPHDTPASTGLTRLGRAAGPMGKVLNRDERPLLEFWAPRSERNHALLEGEAQARWLHQHFQ
jgi:spermidine synthase